MSKKKVNKNKVGIAIMFIFTIIGIIFIILGLKEYKSVKNEYSEERIEQKLITLKSELNNQNNKIEEQRDKAVDERTTYINELNVTTDESRKNEINKSIDSLTKAIDELNSYIQNEYCLSGNDLVFIACSIRSDISKLENIDINYEISTRLDKYILYTMIGSFTIICGVLISSGLSLRNKKQKKKIHNDLKLLKESTDMPEEMIKIIEEKTTKKKGSKNVKK